MNPNETLAVKLQNKHFDYITALCEEQSQILSHHEIKMDFLFLQFIIMFYP